MTKIIKFCTQKKREKCTSLMHLTKDELHLLFNAMAYMNHHVWIGEETNALQNKIKQELRFYYPTVKDLY